MWYRPKEPYDPWKIKESDFPAKGSMEEKAKFLLGYVVLAPSTFNVQPWLFSIEDNKITLKPDFTRSLKTSDKNNRLLYVSLGCATKNLEIASTYFGFGTKKLYVKNGDELNVEVVLSTKPSIGPANNFLFKAILKRVTNRSPYLSKSLPQELLKDVVEVSGKEGLVASVISDSTTKSKLSRLVRKGDLAMWSDPKFKEEHLKWVRHNITKKHDGMPAFSVGIPLLASFFAELAIKYLPYAKIQSKKNQFLLSTTPYFVFLLSEKNDKKTWVKVGEVLEEVWLNATTRGVALAPLAQIHAIGNLYKDSMKALQTTLRPQFFFRLGYASRPAYTSPRRKVREVLSNEKR